MSDTTFSIIMIVIIVLILLMGCLAMASFWDDISEYEEETEVKYIIAGDTEQYKGCLIMSCGSSKERAEDTLQRLLSDPDENDKMMIEGYSNLRVEEVEQKDCWWED